MRFKYLLPTLSLLTAFATLTAEAKSPTAPQSETAPKAKDKKAKKKPIAPALKNLDYLTENKPNLKAKYYILLQSASWCGPCNAEMPTLVEQYKRMQGCGKVELILLSADSTPEAATKFLDKYGAVFPVVMGKDEKVADIPGYEAAKGIPFALFISAKGELMDRGHGAKIKDWETIFNVKGRDPKPGKKTADKDDDKNSADKKDGSKKNSGKNDENEADDEA